MVNFILAVMVCLLNQACCFMQDLPNQDISPGVYFEYKLPKDKFSSFVSKSDYIRFTVSRLGGPDLPNWLRLEQDTPSDDAFVYGTPPLDNPSNLTLEVTGWDKRDYNTTRRKLNLIIKNFKESPRYIAEFTITNFNIDVFLLDKHPTTFKSKLERIWRSPNITLKVVKVESMLDRGGRVPIPPKKEGVFIAIGGDEEYTLLQADMLGCQGLKPDIKKIFNPSNLWVIDWCNVKLYDTEDPLYKANSSLSKTNFKDPIIQSSYAPPALDPLPRDYDTLYILILVLLAVIILVIVIILAIIMCCFRQGKDKRDAATPNPQLKYHDSILRTTFHLRRMDTDNPDLTRRSNGQTTPRQTPRHQSPPPHTSTPYERTVTPDEEDSPHVNAPPPYRLPPPSAVSLTTPNGTGRFYSPDSYQA